MRALQLTMAACLVALAVKSNHAGSPQAMALDGRVGVLQPRIATSPDFDKAVAGLPQATQPVRLTWERLYALALVRTRSGRDSLLPSVDERALIEQASRLGVADFARFSRDFYADPADAQTPFLDPSAAVLQLTSRLQAVENADRSIAIHQNLKNLIGERVQGEASGLSQIEMDITTAALFRARQNRADEIRRFRDGLDKLKVALGLSPRAAVILDRQILMPFRAAFDSVDNWARLPDRSLSQLPRLIARLPAVGDVVIDGLQLIDKNGDVSEDILTRASQRAIKNLAGADKGQPPWINSASLELSVRRRLRNLFDTARSFETETHCYELAVRVQDQSYERLMSPPEGSLTAARAPHFNDLIEQIDQVLKTENRLVAHWTNFRAERLALYRELRALPCDGWSSFYKDLLPASTAAEAAPAAVPEPAGGNVPQAPPPPPTPPPAAPVPPRT